MPCKGFGGLHLPASGVDGALFSTPGGKPYATSTAKDDLASVLSFCGLDTKRYKSHSFRIGAASDAALRGFSDAQIRLMGRWLSDAFRQYIHLPYKVAPHESGFVLVPFVTTNGSISVIIYGQNLFRPGSDWLVQVG